MLTALLCGTAGTHISNKIFLLTWLVTRATLQYCKDPASTDPDNTPSNQRQVALDDDMARADNSWKADDDGGGVVCRCRGHISHDVPMELCNLHLQGLWV